MANVQILHLGGLELDETNFEERKNQFKALKPLLVGVKCVVICGNLTKAGNFDLLEPCLKLLESDDCPRQSILVAPGPADPEEGFREFFANYYGAAHQPPVRESLDVRSPRDITLIAARFDFYGQVEGKDRAKAEMKQVCLLLRERFNAWESSGKQHKLRVLAMSANPFQAPPHLYLDMEKELDALQQDIDLILCGPTHVPVIPLQPFSTLPAVIGTPDGPIAAKPGFSFNIIELRLPPRPRSQQEPGRIQYAVRTYGGQLRPKEPDFRYMTAGFESSSSQIESVLLCKQTLLPKIEKFLDSDELSLIEVYGYGHVWKSVIKDGLHSLSRIGGHDVTVETFILSRYPDPPDRTRGRDWIDSDLPLLKRVETWSKALPQNSGIAIAVVVDEAYSPNVQADANRLDEVKTRLARKFGMEKRDRFPVRIIYLCSSYGVKVVDARDAEGSMDRQFLDPIESQTLNDFLMFASCELPIRSDVFKRLTGGYVGFIKLLMEGLREHYQRMGSGDSDEQWRFEDSVRYVCEVSPKLRDETVRFFNSLKYHYVKGREIADRFLKTMQTMKEKNVDSLLVEDIFITFADAEAAQLTPDFGDMVTAGVVRRVEKERRFLLRERIPFLVQLLHPKPYLFLSCADEDRIQMEALHETLKKQGYQCFYWREAELEDINQGLEGGIASRLAQCEYVVVLWTETSIKSSFVMREAREALGIPGRMRLLNWFDGVIPAPHKEKRDALARKGQRGRAKNDAGKIYCKELTEFNNGVEATSMAQVVHIVNSQLG